MTGVALCAARRSRGRPRRRRRPVALSAGTAASLGRPALAAGAALFAFSDLSVARERFVAPGLANSLWGLPAYFAAQLLLALASGPDAAPP